MIKNDRQYRITRAQAENFFRTLRSLEASAPPEGVHRILHKAQIDALRGQAMELQSQVDDYEALRSGQRRVIDIRSFDDLPQALIQARIASGMTQEDLASKLGIKHQQIQRYEATDYRSASLNRVKEVARVLRIETLGSVGLAERRE